MLKNIPDGQRQLWNRDGQSRLINNLLINNDSSHSYNVLGYDSPPPSEKFFEVGEKY